MGDMINTGNQMVYLAAPMWTSSVWIAMMGEAFKVADIERDALVAQGPWTARTTSIERYSQVDLYA